MQNIFTSKLRLNNAQQFVEAFVEPDPTSVYLFYARARDWDDDSVRVPVDSVQDSEYYFWDEFLSLKKITSAGVSYVKERKNWLYGTIYIPYDYENGDLFSTSVANTFYVMNSTLSVYKCLYNNEGGASIVEPSSLQAGTVQSTSDGYKWIYLYSVGPNDKFLTASWMPVIAEPATVSASVNGAIQAIFVTASGNGYYYLTGTASNPTATTIDLPSSANNNGVFEGSGIYIVKDSISQYKTITSHVGNTVTVDTAFNPVPDVSTSFIIGPKITITGDGSFATAYANVSLITAETGSINRITIITEGSGYAKAYVTVVGSGSTGQLGSGGVLKASIPPPGGHGADVVAGLNAINVMLQSDVFGDERDSITLSDFHALGFIRNPLLLADGTMAESPIYDQTQKLILDVPTTAFANDEQIFTLSGSTTNATAFVVDYANTTTLRVSGANNVFTATMQIRGAASGETANIISILSPPLKKYSGDIMFIETANTLEVHTRSIAQSESVNFVVQF